jgi:hypothetical protein
VRKFTDSKINGMKSTYGWNIQCNNWKIAYEHHISEEKEGTSLEKGSKRKFPPWICLLARSFQQRWSAPPLSPLVWSRYLVATLPVTVASCECTHSNVKIIDNNLRVAMSPNRLEDLVQISNERDLANNIELSKLVEIFKLAKPHKFLM